MVEKYNPHRFEAERVISVEKLEKKQFNHHTGEFELAPLFRLKVKGSRGTINTINLGAFSHATWIAENPELEVWCRSPEGKPTPITASSVASIAQENDSLKAKMAELEAKMQAMYESIQKPKVTK